MRTMRRMVSIRSLSDGDGGFVRYHTATRAVSSSTSVIRPSGRQVSAAGDRSVAWSAAVWGTLFLIWGPLVAAALLRSREREG